MVKSFMNAQDTQLSKFLSLVLRHQPEKIGLQLDAQGWCQVTELLAKSQAAGVALDPESLHRVVSTNSKQRFAFSEDGQHIRASQGHSVAVALQYAPSAPPELLFHGTSSGNLPAIRQSGLQRQQRQHVHLSADIQTARQVGKRHGPVAILQVRAADLAQTGQAFYLSANGVWLTEAVPVKYLIFPELP